VITTIDFETFWSQTYTLNTLGITNYVLHPLFQVIGVSIQKGDGPITWHTDGDIKPALDAIDWDNAALLSHNTPFDGAILAWHYGKLPKLYLDTLAMARAMTHAYIQSSSLDSVSRHLGLPPKGEEVLHAKGKRREDFSDGELASYGEYCAHDSWLCRRIFDCFLAEPYRFPLSELWVIDASVRMFVEPSAQLNMHVLAEHAHMLSVERERVFATTDRKVYSSNDRFAQLLISLGVTPPVKLSPSDPQKFIYALAQGDPEYRRFCERGDLPMGVQAHLAARKRAKSTIEETRTNKLLDLAKLDWYPGGYTAANYQGRGWMPVPYTYYGAHTGRFSGAAGFNFANLPRGSRIRDAITAPEGYRIVHRDASQIECRTLATLAGCRRLLDGFRQGQDVYCDFASLVYRRTITREHKQERFAGKVAQLSLGYGVGWLKFKNTLFIGQGGVSLSIDDNLAVQIVQLWRDTHPEIRRLWGVATGIIEDWTQGTCDPRLVIPCVTVSETAPELRLPNGLALRYPELTGMRGEGDEDWKVSYRYQGFHRGEWQRLYGAKMIENIVQALARIIVTDAMQRILARTGYRPFMGTYDSWDYMIAENEVEEFDKILTEEFDRAPNWLPEVPLASEGGWGRTLLDAERSVND